MFACSGTDRLNTRVPIHLIHLRVNDAHQRLIDSRTVVIFTHKSQPQRSDNQITVCQSSPFADTHTGQTQLDRFVLMRSNVSLTGISFWVMVETISDAFDLQLMFHILYSKASVIFCCSIFCSENVSSCFILSLFTFSTLYTVRNVWDVSMRNIISADTCMLLHFCAPYVQTRHKMCTIKAL